MQQDNTGNCRRGCRFRESLQYPTMPPRNATWYSSPTRSPTESSAVPLGQFAERATPPDNRLSAPSEASDVVGRPGTVLNSAVTVGRSQSSASSGAMVPEPLLVALRGELTAELEATRIMLDDLRRQRADRFDDDEHDPEGVPLSGEYSRLDGLLRAIERRIAEVDAALINAKAGRYGVCLACGGRSRRVDSKPDRRPLGVWRAPLVSARVGEAAATYAADPDPSAPLGHPDERVRRAAASTRRAGRRPARPEKPRRPRSPAFRSGSSLVAAQTGGGVR